MVELRDYQEDSVVSVFDYFTESEGHPLLVLPTGSGKSIVAGEFIRRACAIFPDTRILLLSHVKELLVQDAAAILKMWPGAPVSFYSAGLNSKNLNGQVIVAGIQSIYKRAYDVQECDLVIIDEAHLLNASEAGMYRRFLKDLQVINPYLKIIGLTATPWRMDTGLLHKGPGALFSDICYEVKLAWMIDQGYLAPLRCKRTATVLDVSDVHIRGGEFIASELEAAVDIESTNAAIVEELIERGADRGSWLLFCAGINHATHIRDLVREAGISAETVFGDTPAAERARVLGDFKAGRLRCMVNVNVLTTGFDAPGVDLIGFLRPTRSKGLYVQMAGRGTRTAEGKEDCLICDFAGCVAMHGPVDLVTGDERDKPSSDEPGVAPVKTCPSCEELVHPSVRRCPACGHEFPPPAIQLAKKAISSAILARELKDEWLKVDAVSYHEHFKPGSPTSLRVEYRCGLVTYREWVCLEHTGFPRQKAVGWWTRRAPGEAAPKTVDDALAFTHELATPRAITVQPEGKYFRITGVRF